MKLAGASERRRRVIRRRLRLLGMVTFLSMVCPILFSFLTVRTTFIILGDSMTPTLNAGDVIGTHAVNGDIANGTVVVFKSPLGGFETHRIIGRVSLERGTYYLARGDGNSETDSFLISEDGIVGAVSIVIPRIGLLLMIPRDNALIMTLGLIATYAILTFRLGCTATRARQCHGKSRMRNPIFYASLFVAALIFSNFVSAFSSINLLYSPSNKKVSVTSPSVVLEEGNAGNSTIHDNGTSADVSVAAPTGSPLTYDYVLKVVNQAGEPRKIRLKAYSESNIQRLQNCTIHFHNGGQSCQIYINAGSYEQQVGNWYDLAASGTDYVAVTVLANTSESSLIYTYLEVLIPDTGIDVQYRIFFTIT